MRNNKTVIYRLIANIAGFTAGLLFAGFYIHFFLETGHGTAIATILSVVKAIAMMIIAGIIATFIFTKGISLNCPGSDEMALDAAMSFMAMPLLWFYIKTVDKQHLRSIMSPATAIATIEMIIIGAIATRIQRKYITEKETLLRNVYLTIIIIIIPFAGSLSNANIHILSALFAYMLSYLHLCTSHERSSIAIDTEGNQCPATLNAITYLGQQEDTTAITMIMANNTSVSFKNSSPKSRVRNKRKKTKRWRQLRMLRRRSKRSLGH
ncbi:hypothetical protein IJV57_02130 [Candidatus Saccharibacteria bacterium]|nr:hypothetical protein [Candidatus Saccharibacteria bacterium]